MSKVPEIERQLKMKSSDIIYKNISTENLKTAAEMYIYLITCPGNDELQDWFKLWSTFYIDLFQNKSANQIILTLNRVMKQNTEENKKSSVGKIFKKLGKLLKEINNLRDPDPEPISKLCSSTKI